MYATTAKTSSLDATTAKTTVTMDRLTTAHADTTKLTTETKTTSKPVVTSFQSTTLTKSTMTTPRTSPVLTLQAGSTGNQTTTIESTRLTSPTTRTGPEEIVLTDMSTVLSKNTGIPIIQGGNVTSFSGTSLSLTTPLSFSTSNATSLSLTTQLSFSTSNASETPSATTDINTESTSTAAYGKTVFIMI